MEDGLHNSLPADPALLQRMLREQQAEHQKTLTRMREEHAKAEAQIREEHAKAMREIELEKLRLLHQLAVLKKQYYGPRADKVDLGQMLLDFARDLEARPITPEDLAASAPEATGVGQASPAPENQARQARRVRGGRRPIQDMDHLPMVEFTHRVPEDQKTCANGHPMVVIGQEVTWQIERAPGFFYRIKHVQEKLGCKPCDADGLNPQITLAQKPPQPIEKGMAGPGLLAFVVTSKYADYLPLYRLEAIFGRAGLAIDRSTMCLWMGDVADLVTPVYDLMARRVLASHVVHTDDTVMPMLDVGRCRRSRMWVYVGDTSNPYHVFDFTLGRGRDGPASFLAGFGGVLQGDAYSGYGSIALEKQIVLAGCWAHARRKLVDCRDLAPAVVDPPLLLIRRLFAIEDQAGALSPQERLAMRRDRSVPILAELEAKLPLWRQQVLPKHPVAAAINYILHQWKPLTVFAGDPAVALDNNVAEREMKRQVLNRKNSLFVGNERGGRTAAILSSMTSTCRRHGIDPQVYFTQLLTNLPSTPMSQVGQWLADEFKRRNPDPAAAHARAMAALNP